MKITKRSYFSVLFICSLVCFAILAGYFQYVPYDEDHLRIVIRWTAKVSAILFALAFVSSSIHYFFPMSWTSNMLGIRPHLGLCFCVTHTFHLASLLLLQSDFHPVFDLAKHISLFGGGLAYLFMYIMTFTTFPSTKDKMQVAHWNLLHIIGGYWILFIFTRSYFLNVIRKEQYYFIFTFLVLVFLLRIGKLLSIYLRRKRATPKTKQPN